MGFAACAPHDGGTPATPDSESGSADESSPMSANSTLGMSVKLVLAASGGSRSFLVSKVCCGAVVELHSVEDPVLFCPVVDWPEALKGLCQMLTEGVRCSSYVRG